MSTFQPSEKFPVPHTSIPPKGELAFDPPGGFPFYFPSPIQKLLNSSCSHGLVLPYSRALMLLCSRALTLSCSHSLMFSCSHALMLSMLSCSPALLYPCSPALPFSCSRALMLSCPHALLLSCSHAPKLPCSHALMPSCSQPCRCFAYSTRSPLRKISLTTSQSTLNKQNIKRIRTYKSNKYS